MQEIIERLAGLLGQHYQRIEVQDALSDFAAAIKADILAELTREKYDG